MERIDIIRTTAPSPKWGKAGMGAEGDHLGSTSYVSSTNGLPYQYIAYLPFGESLLEEKTSTYSTPYKFNAKELDDESGLYYYGARYYDPKISVFLGVDPLADKHPNYSPYHYCFNNPIKLIDPNGLDTVTTPAGNKTNVGTGYKASSDGNYLSGTVDGEKLQNKVWDPNATYGAGSGNDGSGGYVNYNGEIPDNSTIATTAQSTAHGMGLGSALYGESARGLTTTTSTISKEIQAAKVISNIAKVAKITGYAGNIISGTVNLYNVTKNPSPSNYARAAVSGFAIGLNLVNFAVPGLGTLLSIGVNTIDMAGGFNWLYDSLEPQKSK